MMNLAMKFFHSGDRRPLVCRMICWDRPVTVASVYPPAKGEEKVPWLKTINEKFQEFQLTSPCDVVGGDWNLTLETINRVIATGEASNP